MYPNHPVRRLRAQRRLEPPRSMRGGMAALLTQAGSTRRAYAPHITEPVRRMILGQLRHARVKRMCAPRLP